MLFGLVGPSVLLAPALLLGSSALRFSSRRSAGPPVPSEGSGGTVVRSVPQTVVVTAA